MLGGAGMLGHKMFQVLARRFANTACTIRSQRDECVLAALSGTPGRVIEGVDVSKVEEFADLLRQLRPTAIINCVGAIKQRPEAYDASTAIAVNSLLPHRVAETAKEWGGRVIHFSTDCVFSGLKGRYREEDEPDATDLYGRTKILGELRGDHTLTLRVSFIGREIHHRQSLLEWFLAQDHQQVRGYRQVWWSGVTSNHLAELVGDLVQRHPALAGLYQVSSGRISKYDLLRRLRAGYDVDIQVDADDSVVCDRSMDGSRFERATGYKCPPWETLIKQLVDDPTPYRTLAARS